MAAGAGLSIGITTPLGSNDLLPTGFSGREAISELFDFQVDLVAPNGTQVPFEALLGQPATVSLTSPSGAQRFFSGIISRFGQGARGPKLTSYVAELVPSFWLSTRRQNSRIFQHLSVPDILQQVLSDITVELRLDGTFLPRNYCVQYRESDFAFASRLMEEEGIYYYFEHDNSGHHLVVGNSPRGNTDVPGPSSVVFDPTGAGRPGSAVVFQWEKDQALRSGLYTLRDYNFQLPDNDFEEQASIIDSVPVGVVTHHLKLPVNEGLEIYEYPGGYAKRFDGDAVRDIDADGQRTVGIRMDQETVPSIQVGGAATAPQLTPGYGFTLQQHFDGNGRYVLTSVEHSAQAKNAAGGGATTYTNRFTCIPDALPYRPARRTPRPTVPGPQTAVVVGPAGEETFIDQYGRVKVQFHWDREGKNDENSSCWMRVAIDPGAPFTPPRIGWEVVVDFEEGDPDQPIVVGTVFNPNRRPPPP
jgi:type VI secretion system secreted protein VgrG